MCFLYAHRQHACEVMMPDIALPHTAQRPCRVHRAVRAAGPGTAGPGSSLQNPISPGRINGAACSFCFVAILWRVGLRALWFAANVRSFSTPAYVDGRLVRRAFLLSDLILSYPPRPNGARGASGGGP